MNQGQHQRALQLLTDLRSRYPESAVVHARLGRAYGILGSPVDSVNSYRESARLDPLHAGTWAELAVSLIELRQMPEAEAALRQALKLEPRTAFNWGAYGVYYGELKSGADAVRCFEKAVELDPQNADYWEYLAKARELNADAKGAAEAKARAKALANQSDRPARTESSATAATPRSHSGMKIGTWEKPQP
jgi:predicted Zn-dependent protease